MGLAALPSSSPLALQRDRHVVVTGDSYPTRGSRIRDQPA